MRMRTVVQLLLVAKAEIVLRGLALVHPHQDLRVKIDPGDRMARLVEVVILPSVLGLGLAQPSLPLKEGDLMEALAGVVTPPLVLLLASLRKVRRVLPVRVPEMPLNPVVV